MSETPALKALDRLALCLDPRAPIYTGELIAAIRAALERCAARKRNDYTIGFASFKDGTFEFDIARNSDGKTGHLKGETKDIEELADILPPCVPLRAALSAPAQPVGCPRAKSDMTPCIIRDGELARADDGVCVGCGVAIPPPDPWRAVAEGLAKALDESNEALKYYALSNYERSRAREWTGKRVVKISRDSDDALAAFAAAKEADKP